jgi:WD40 repeat protein
MAKTSYRLRCQLHGHEADVRSVSAITEYDGLVSGSRDRTARIWRPSEYAHCLIIDRIRLIIKK